MTHIADEHTQGFLRHRTACLEFEQSNLVLPHSLLPYHPRKIAPDAKAPPKCGKTQYSTHRCSWRWSATVSQYLPISIGSPYLHKGIPQTLFFTSTSGRSNSQLFPGKGKRRSSPFLRVANSSARAV